MRMKKIILLTLLATALSGCADRDQYEQAILIDIDKDQDIKDYKLGVEDMASCIVEQSAKNMPGMFPLDPDRMMAYRNYAKMLTLKESEDPQKTLEELKVSFGSAKAMSDAHNNYTQSVMSCVETLVQKTN